MSNQTASYTQNIASSEGSQMNTCSTTCNSSSTTYQLNSNTTGQTSNTDTCNVCSCDPLNTSSVRGFQNASDPNGGVTTLNNRCASLNSGLQGMTIPSTF